MRCEPIMPREPLSSPARWALTSLALSMLMPSLDTSIANAGLPILATAFEATFQQVQWIVLAYLLAITTLIVSVGRLGDGFGRRRLLLIGIGIFTSASLACALAPGLGWLIGARAVQGVGAAIMFALTVALVADAVPKARAGSAMGLLATMSATGTSLGPSLGGLLMTHVGWQAIFLLNVPLGLLNIWLVYRFLPAGSGRRAACRVRLFRQRGAGVDAGGLCAGNDARRFHVAAAAGQPGRRGVVFHDREEGQGAADSLVTVR
jgi:MFS family permease